MASDEQREFWSKIAQKYDEVADLQIGSRTRSMVREQLNREGRLGNVVEFGCGTGFYTQALADKADGLTATDLSPGMLAVAKDRINVPSVTFQLEDCQQTSFAAEGFDTAFISLVIHFTEPEKTLAEMRRILKPGGALIIVNLDPKALSGLDRLRCVIRVLYYGLTRYRVKPPKQVTLKNVVSSARLCDLLKKFGFELVSMETIRDPSRSSNVPVEYVRAVKDVAGHR